MREKRIHTISARVTPELETQLQAIACARDVSLSDFIFQTLEEKAQDEYRRYLKLRSAFEVNQGLPCKRQDDDV